VQVSTSLSLPAENALVVGFSDSHYPGNFTFAT